MEGAPIEAMPGHRRGGVTPQTGPRRPNPKGARGLRPLGGVACRRRCAGIDSSSRLASDHRSLARDAVRLLPRAANGPNLVARAFQNLPDLIGAFHTEPTKILFVNHSSPQDRQNFKGLFPGNFLSVVVSRKICRLPPPAGHSARFQDGPYGPGPAENSPGVSAAAYRDFSRVRRF